MRQINADILISLSRPPHAQNEGKLVLKRAEETKTASAMHGLSRCVARSAVCVAAAAAAAAGVQCSVQRC